jgi:hypothetical protein
MTPVAEQPEITDRIGYIVHNDADEECEADAYGERHGHTGNLDRGHQQDVGQIENRPANQRGHDAAAGGL